jgi:hypothetical protein
MPKKSKSKKIVYESENLYRWNLCQKLAKTIYRSSIATETIQENIDNIFEELNNKD